MPDSIDEQLLRVFVAVAQEASLSRASDLLRRPSKTVTRDLNRLEASVGVRLTNRTTHGVTLTQSGVVFLVEARKMLVQIDHSRRAAQAAAEPNRNHLRIAFVPASCRILPSAIARFRVNHPRTTFELIDAPTTDQIQWLIAGALDLAFCYQHSVDDRIQTLTIATETLVLAAPLRHCLANEISIDPTGLSEFQLIGDMADPHPLSKTFLEELHTEVGLVPTFTNWGSTTAARLLLVAAGIGTTLTTEGASDYYNYKGIIWRPIETKVTIPLLACCRSDTISELTEEFIEDLRQVAQRDLISLDDLETQMGAKSRQ